MTDYGEDLKCPLCGSRMFATGGVLYAATGEQTVCTVECPEGHFVGVHAPRPKSPREVFRDGADDFGGQNEGLCALIPLTIIGVIIVVAVWAFGP